MDKWLEHGRKLVERVAEEPVVVFAAIVAYLAASPEEFGELVRAALALFGVDVGTQDLVVDAGKALLVVLAGVLGVRGKVEPLRKREREAAEAE